MARRRSSRSRRRWRSRRRRAVQCSAGMIGLKVLLTKTAQV